MKTREVMSAAIFLGMALVILSNPAPKKKVSKSTIKVSQSAPLPRCETYYVSADTTNKAEVLKNADLKPCDKIVIIEPAIKAIQHALDKVE